MLIVVIVVPIGGVVLLGLFAYLFCVRPQSFYVTDNGKPNSSATGDGEGVESTHEYGLAPVASVDDNA